MAAMKPFQKQKEKCAYTGLWRPPPGALATLVVVALAFCAFMFFTHIGEMTYFVAGTKVNYREQPNGRVLGQLDKGKKITCKEIKDGWCRTYFGRQRAFISMMVLAKEKPQQDNSEQRSDVGTGWERLLETAKKS